MSLSPHSKPQMTAEDVFDHLNVSRETSARLTQYVDLLKKWQKTINLVSKNTLNDVWARHILDCGQIFPFTGDATSKIMDIGSGAGLPGLVLAIMRQGQWGDYATPITLVESDQRKCAFLSVAAHSCGVTVDIRNQRLENLEAMQPDVITARALASVDTLLEWTKAQHHPKLQCVFLKGAQVDEELTSLAEKPNIKIEKSPSLTQGNGVILRLSGLA